MQPLRLSLEGFGSYREPQEIDFDAVRLACITGSNGAGKSTIFNGISWALLGITPTGDIDQLVSEGEQKAVATLLFRHAGELYRITRTRNRSKTTSASLEHETSDGWVPMAEKGPRAVDAEIAAMIGISKETYAATVLLAQGDSGRFAEADPGARKKILSEILSLDTYSQLAKDARERSAAAKRDVDQAQSRMAEIDGQLAGFDDTKRSYELAAARLIELAPLIVTAENEFKQAEREASAGDSAAERLAVLEGQIDAARAREAARRNGLRNQIDAARAKVTRVESRIADIHSRISSAETADESIAGLSSSRKALEGDLAAADEKLTRIMEAGVAAKSDEERHHADATRLGTDLADESERLKLLSHDESTCFACGQGLDETLRLRMIDDTQARINVLTDEIAAAHQRAVAAGRLRTELREALATANQEKASLGTLSDLDQRIAKAREQAAAMPGLESELTAATTELVGAEDELFGLQESVEDDSDPVTDALVEEADGLADVVAGTLDAVSRAGVLDQQLSKLKQEELSLSIDNGRREERLTVFAGLAEERGRWATSATAAGADAEDFARLAKAFGSDGIPNMIFTGVVEEMERDASEMMERMTGGKFRLELHTETTTKDGSAKGTLDVVIATETGERPYKSLSGGERFRVDLALRVALTRLLTRRSGSTIDFLALDEGWGALDPEGITAMLDELRELHDEFPLVLTITHTPEVAAAFEARFEVERDSDGTSVVHLVAS